MPAPKLSALAKDARIAAARRRDSELALTELARKITEKFSTRIAPLVAPPRGFPSHSLSWQGTVIGFADLLYFDGALEHVDIDWTSFCNGVLAVEHFGFHNPGKEAPNNFEPVRYLIFVRTPGKDFKWKLGGNFKKPQIVEITGRGYFARIPISEFQEF